MSTKKHVPNTWGYGGELDLVFVFDSYLKVNSQREAAFRATSLTLTMCS